MGDVGLVDRAAHWAALCSLPSRLPSGGAWWSVAAQDRNQQRKQRLDLDLAAKLLAFLRSLGVRQREILASSLGLLSRYTLGSALSWMRWMRGCGSAGTTLSSDASW